MGGGDRSIDEMAHAWVNVTYLSEEDYKAEVEAKERRSRPHERQQQWSRISEAPRGRCSFCRPAPIAVSLTRHHAVVAAAVVALGSPARAQLPAASRCEVGSERHPAFEGWFKNPDGCFEMQFGYHNRNTKEEVDIPIGPNNRFEPGNARSGSADVFHAAPPMGQLHGGRAQGLRPKKADMDHCRQRADDDGADASRSALDHCALSRMSRFGNTCPSIRFDPMGQTYTGPPKGLARHVQRQQ